MSTESIILRCILFIIVLGLIAIGIIIDGFDRLFKLLEKSDLEKP